MLEKGWFQLIFKTHQVAVQVASVMYSTDSTPILFKFWALTFDANQERSDVLLVLFQLPSLLTYMWNPQSFTNLDNNMSSFIEVDYSFEETRDLSLACIIVSVNLCKWLHEAIEIGMVGE